MEKVLNCTLMSYFNKNNNFEPKNYPPKNMARNTIWIQRLIKDVVDEEFEGMNVLDNQQEMSLPPTQVDY